jgi:hypothetical protein
MALLDRLLGGLMGCQRLSVAVETKGQTGGVGERPGGLFSGFEQARWIRTSSPILDCNGPIKKFHCRRFSARIRCRLYPANRVWRPMTSRRNLASISRAWWTA